MLGDWQVALGRREEALMTYQQALLWHPGDERIQERIERLLALSP